ncbi:AGAP006730-PA-like protein [Anopheles sinensis]|uniref:AGAP006730-PA-like protein n=1 Tax=Anopheles sinensis TaxID=74873 RepID=A0A084WLJ2_ANOSI|nr:AGAP006730-PA-like protein [Anopheles sinensis]
MPCEKCNVKFGLLTRKRSCYECRRLFCRDCLSKRQDRFFCPSCTIFTKRPLSRIDLAQLKVKDLIFYLQSKHISTTGCVEKDDLINLVIAHVNSGGSSPRTPGAFSATSSTTESASRGSSRYGSFSQNGDRNYSNTFDHIKNTCQNLFSSFSDRFNGDSPVASRNERRFTDQPRANGSFSPQEDIQRNISTQPRFGSNNVYHSTDASERTSGGVNSSVSSSGPTSSADTSAASSSFSSPIRGADPRSRTVTDSVMPEAPNGDIPSPVVGKSDEDIPRRSKFARRSVSHADLLPSPEPAGPSQEAISDGVPSAAATPKGGPPSKSQTPSSSFDDLLGEGSSSNADHAIAPDTLAVTTTETDAQMTTAASMDDTEQWQIINTSDANGGGGGGGDGGVAEVGTAGPAADVTEANDATTVTIFDAEESSDSISNSETNKSKPAAPMMMPVAGESPIHPAPSVVTRRRSDSYLLSLHPKQQRPVGAPIVGQLFGGHPFTLSREMGVTGARHPGPGLMNSTLSTDAIPSSSHPANHTSMCFRCGKRRNGIRRQLKKFRRQLEAATGATEAEKRRQLEAFLNYLERRSKGSFELTDSESITEEASVSLAEETPAPMARPTVNDSHESEAERDGMATNSRADGQTSQPSNRMPSDDTTVCVNLYSSGNQQLVNMKQINLSDIKESADLDVLSVKQLKGILMVNRVDFKGCCEKAELRERVLRLWRDFKSIPSIEKLTSDDLCKICMDAPIECVILECGHMTTCTACGKVLTECPICRQYIVRVVRFFRA